VERLTLREIVLLVGTGLIVGLALFQSANRVLRSRLFDIAPGDPVAVVLYSNCCARSHRHPRRFVPARRATRVDPAMTLRCE
jgi:hypothetical protein